MTTLSKIYDITDATLELTDIIQGAEAHGFKRAKGTGRRTGGSARRNNLSEYEYINTRAAIRNRPLMDVIKKAAKRLNIYDYMLVNYILQLQPGDFLDLQDYWQDDEGLSKVEGVSNKWTLGKYFSIALTEGNSVKIVDEIVYVPLFHAIEFKPATLHSVPKVNKKHTWMVFMVPDYLDLDSTLNKE